MGAKEKGRHTSDASWRKAPSKIREVAILSSTLALIQAAFSAAYHIELCQIQLISLIIVTSLHDPLLLRLGSRLCCFRRTLLENTQV
jgi:hypothetical protein